MIMVHYRNMITQLKKEMKKFASLKRAKSSMWFFKTGKGEYGEGDKFVGVSGMDQRKLAKKYYKDISFSQIAPWLKNPIHEYRQVALLILVYKYQKGSEVLKKKIFNYYIKNTKHINNWDLVDITAPHIVGDYLLDKKRDVLYKFARSKDLWKKRIAIIATFAFIREKDFKDALKIAKILLHDKHDLIHKAVGWMLREVGNRDIKAEERFLKQHYKVMPRTMLRYAIEKFSEKKRLRWLKG